MKNKETILETFRAIVSGVIRRGGITRVHFHKHPVEVNVIHGSRNRQDIGYRIGGVVWKLSAREYYNLNPVRV